MPDSGGKQKMATLEPTGSRGEIDTFDTGTHRRPVGNRPFFIAERLKHWDVATFFKCKKYKDF